MATASPFDKSRASYKGLRDYLRANLRNMTVVDSGGRYSHMVWIPLFEVPANLIGTWPSEAFTVGGFWVDQYDYAHDDATSQVVGSGSVAVSRPGVRRWTSVTVEDAETACEARVINGESCSLIGSRHWGTLLLVSIIIGHELKGATEVGGYDHRDTGEAHERGIVPEGDEWPLTGTGPWSWSNTGLASGVFDLLGGTRCYMSDAFSALGRYVDDYTIGTMDDSGGISAADTQVTIDVGDDLDDWPSTGLVKMGSELATYADRTDNGDGTVTFGGMERGARGTTAAIHSDGSDVELHHEFSIVPEGYSVLVTGLNNTTNPVTFTAEDVLTSPDAPAPTVGHFLRIDSEELEITAVAGDQITVTRGANGTTAATHDDWSGAIYDPNNGDGYFHTLRDEPKLRGCMFPKSLQSTSGDADLKDYWDLSLGQAISRGGSLTGTGQPQYGFESSLGGSGGGSSTGFRAVLELNK